jgi:eukaryotic-like serine/threonine-protein kinase
MRDMDATPEATSEPRIGLLVADKYRLEALLGSGAMGSVWRAVHVVLGHSVAVKFLRQSLGQSASAHARFEQEAKVSARLGEMSNHITRVSDYGFIGSDTPFVVMELLRGESLAQRIGGGRALPLFTVAAIVAQLARALSVAHRAGVVHRDLKPANVFLCETEEGQAPIVKLLDFGVAKLLEHEGAQATMAGEVVGTPSYMSPEQIAGDDNIDERADLWALAAMTYRMAVGRNPFGVGTLLELVYRISSTSPLPPTSIVPSLPQELDAWMERGLAKHREDRFETARQLSDALAVLAGLTPAEPTMYPPSHPSSKRAMVSGGVSTMTGLPPASDGTVASHTVPKTSRTASPSRSRRPIAFVALGAMAATLVGGAVWRWSDHVSSASGAPNNASTLDEGTTGAPNAPEVALPTATVTPVSSHHEHEVVPTTTALSPLSRGSAPTPRARSAAPVSHAPARPTPPPHVVHKPAASVTPPPLSSAEKRAAELWRKNDEF